MNRQKSNLAQSNEIEILENISKKIEIAWIAATVGAVHR